MPWLLLLALAATPTEGNNQLALRYERPANAVGCPSQADFEAAVASHLGRNPFAPEAKRSAAAVYEVSAKAVKVRLRVHNERGVVTGERVMSGTLRECSALGEGLAMALALVLDPQRGLAVSPKPTQVVANSEPAADWGGSLYVGPTVGIRTLPGVGPGFLAGGEVRRDIWGVGLEVAWTSGLLRPEVGGAVVAQLWRVSSKGCAHWRMLSGCAVVSAGALRAQGLGFEENRSTTLPWLSVGPRVQVDALTRPLLVTVFAEMPVALLRPQLAIDEGTLWSTPTVQVGLGAAVGWSFD